MKKMLSKEYLDFIGTHACVVTGKYPSECHHEAVTYKFRGDRKRYFDYGAIPLIHEIHLYERHEMGRVAFWDKYELDPKEVVITLIEEYLTLDPLDYDEASEGLELVMNASKT